jgi:hypothetical protein
MGLPGSWSTKACHAYPTPYPAGLLLGYDPNSVRWLTVVRKEALANSGRFDTDGAKSPEIIK